MTSAPRVRQLQLTGLTVALEDASWYAKYVFPFFDAGWRVRLLAFDVLGTAPRRWTGHAALAGGTMRLTATEREVPALETLEPARLEGMLHFDPWWAFRGAGLDDRFVRAVVPTNIAGRYVPLDVPRKVTDVSFDPSLERLVAIEASDRSLGRKTFAEGEIDLRAFLAAPD